MTIRLGATALGLALILAGCGSSDKPAAKSQAALAAAATTTPTATAGGDDGRKDPITVKGRVGDTLTLLGAGLNDDPSDKRKTKIKVTLKGMRGPFKGYELPAGRELIGVVLHFVNIGELVYDDPQPNGQLTVAGGETGKQTNLIQLNGGKDPCDDASLKLSTGKSKDVCIAFDVPKAEKPEALQYVSDSGYGDTALWQLP
jgi:hypothetical protein